MKKTLKIFSILLAACCSLLFLCLVGIRIYLDTSHARQLAQNIINRSIPGTISWTDHSLSLFKGKAVFTNILLKGPGGDLIVKTETLTCDIFLPDLIENILTFQNIILENPVVHLFIDKEGNVNIAGAFITQETPHEESPSRDQEDTPFNVLIRHALVKNGSFQYSSYTKEDILLSSLDLELKNGDLLKQRAQVILESSSGKISIPEILEIPQVQTKARASIDGNKVDVDKILITSGKNSLSVKGRCDVMSGNIKSTLSLIVDGAFFNTTIEDIEGLDGHYIADAAISGELTDPLFSAQLRGNGLSYQDIRFGDLAVNIDYSEGRFSIKRFTASQNQSKLSLSGSVRIIDEKTNNLLSTPSYAITIHDSRLFLEDITQDFTRKVKGEITVSGLVMGNTEKNSGNLKLSGKNIDTDYQNIKEVDITLRLKDNKVFMDKGKVAIIPNEEIEVNGWVSIDGKYDFRSVSKGISFSSIDMISDQNWDNEKAAFSFTGKGDITNPRLNGYIKIIGLMVNDNTMDPIHLTLDVSDMTARISEKEQMDMDITIQLETQNIDGYAYFERIDLHPFLKSTGYDEVKGFLSGRIDLSGNINEVETIQAQILVNELETFWEGNELLRAKDQVLTFKNGFVSLSDIRLSLLKEGFIDLKGGADVNGVVDLTANSKIPVTIIEPFLDDVYDSEGYITCNATVRGPFEKPEARADITFDKIGLETPFLSERLHDTNGRIQLTPDRIILENIDGNFDSGTFAAEGTIDLKDNQIVDSRISVTGHAVPVHIPDEMDIVVNTKLLVTGNKEMSKVSGDITILDGLYFRDVEFNLLHLIPKRSRSIEFEPESADQEIFNNMTLNIKVGYRNPFFVENNISLLELKPDLHLKGTPNSLLLSGRASVESGGIIKYQEREFEVTRGIIDFLNPYRIEPTIDLEGNTKVRDWTIFLNVSGTPDNLSFILKSDPPEQNNDILYLLAFGKTIHESSNNTKSTSTTQMLADIMAEKLQKNLKDNTGLDTFELEYTSDSSDETDSDEVRVTLGKDLSRRLSVKYGVKTRDGQIIQRTTSEYKFLEHLLLDAYNDTNGDYGGGLRYRLEFR